VPNYPLQRASGLALLDLNEGMLTAARRLPLHARMMLRLPVSEEFLLRHLCAMPVAELVAAAGEEGRAALIAHMTEAMSPYVDGYGVVVPQEINVATGHV
jgi:hypothetical protein